jgi:branched-chain amino acid transport system substrate-binding protein
MAMAEQQGRPDDQQVGEYRLLQQLGRGSFGAVYLAEHFHDHTQAAVKLLRFQLSSPDDFKSFLNEARTIRLHHPHIVPLFDFGLTHDNIPYLVMEYAAGGTLRQRYPRGTKLPLETIDIYVSQLASALQYAHDRRVIHRDVKPENMLLRADGTILLSDFGIAKVLEQSSFVSLQTSAGTPAYMAPEQSQGKPCPASDQYALAVIVYEWLVGRLPFQGAGLEVIVQHRLDEPPSLQSLCPELPIQVEQVVLRSLAKIPENRFPTIQQFAEALHTALLQSSLMTQTIQQNDQQTSIPSTIISSQQSALTFPASELSSTDEQANPPTLSDTPPPQELLPTESVAPRRVEAINGVDLEPLYPHVLTEDVTSRSYTSTFTRRTLLVALSFLLLAGMAGGGVWTLLIQQHLQASQHSSTSPMVNNTAITTIKIGSDFPVSGSEQSSGLPAQDGVQYAVDEANSQNLLPGYKFVLDQKDDVGPSGTHDRAVALKNVNDLIGDAEVAGIVGPLNSSIAIAVMPAANLAPIAMISPSNSNDCLTQDTPGWECTGSNELVQQLRPTGNVTYFRTATLDQYQGVALAEYAYKTKGYRKAFVIDDTETYGAGLAKNFVHMFHDVLGGTITNGNGDSVRVTNDYSNLLTTAASENPDVIFFGGIDSTGGDTIREQMSKIAGLEKTPFMVGDGSKTSGFAESVIPLGGGSVYGSVPGVDPSQVAKAKTFLSGYEGKYGASSYGAYSGGGYDDAWILMLAIKSAIDKHVNPPANSSDGVQTKTFRQAVIDAIKQTSYDGVTGHQSFDANGDTLNKAISIYTLGQVGISDGWNYLTAVSPN